VQFAERAQPRATVTSISARHSAHAEAVREPGLAAAPAILTRETSAASPRPREAGPALSPADPPAPESAPVPAVAAEEAAAGGEGERRPESAQPARKAASGRGRRSSVPSWDEIMFGTSRQSD
jgi:hypothetical protein